MKRHARKAYNALTKLGLYLVPGENWGGYFGISAEGDTPEHLDYYSNYWGSEALNKILSDNGLYFEWCNAGVATVHDA